VITVRYKVLSANILAGTLKQEPYFLRKGATKKAPRRNTRNKIGSP
jgi:hypothetical protein